MEYKGFNIDGDGTFGMKVIKPTTRGSVPGELRGVFTTDRFAMNAIDFYLMGKDTKSNAKAVVGD